MDRLTRNPIRRQRLDVSNFTIRNTITNKLLFRQVLPATVHVSNISSKRSFAIARHSLQLRQAVHVLNSPVKRLYNNLVIRQWHNSFNLRRLLSNKLMVTNGEMIIVGPRQIHNTRLKFHPQVLPISQA